MAEKKGKKEKKKGRGLGLLPRLLLDRLLYPVGFGFLQF
jgi:hypothetical protein